MNRIILGAIIRAQNLRIDAQGSVFLGMILNSSTIVGDYNPYHLVVSATPGSFHPGSSSRAQETFELNSVNAENKGTLRKLQILGMLQVCFIQTEPF